MLFNPVNLPYWIFLGMGVSLFLLVIFSGGGDDDLDLDADADVDVDADAGSLHFDTDADGNGDFNALQILGWLGFGKAPLILLLATDFSLLGLIGWMLNVAIGNIWGIAPKGFLAGIVALLALVISLFVGSAIARPLGKIFASFGEDASSDRIIGCIGTVSSASIPVENQGKIGQVDAIDSARNLVTISAALPEWAKIIPCRGQKVLVIDRLPQYYLVIVNESSDLDHWLETSTKNNRKVK
ncbi:DUF1449 family protein [Planktothrix sp. FACHB-1355]|uniref:DUF1449 family protein n=1 Tax=Aerosakkonema funiforme FACHB-1375 TaxID=2949571 RepID=A0A926VJZ1_9CYAN|nr:MULTISPECIES: OB-fold-containig protein [Oscillatoriales]MBD2185206.1 DUF1449 family protein [Aerosakkonema funiforme FACHB-1375]MBD3560086.1 DUF1449 family protein [Planktothrix sp. FACHB-1355]